MSEKKEFPEGVYLIINSQIVQISQDTIRIGRKLENDIVINNETISREHAEIRYENNNFIIYDLNSTGGTFVNNKKVSKLQLNSGDLISLSDTNIMFINNQPKIQVKAQDKTRSLEDQ